MSRDLPGGFLGWLQVGERRWVVPVALGVLIAIAIIAFGKSLWRSDEATCARLYARAATARDSAFVDLEASTMFRGRTGGHPATCGELRRMGRL
jgi:hypothetical protein